MQRNNAKDNPAGGGVVRLRPRASSRQASSQPIAPAVAGQAPPQPAGKSIPKYAHPWRAYFEGVGGRSRLRRKASACANATVDKPAWQGRWRMDVKPSGARDLLVALAGRWLQEVLLQVLDAEEELLLRVRDTPLGLKLQADKFQRRNHVSDLEQPSSRKSEGEDRSSPTAEASPPAGRLQPKPLSKWRHYSKSVLKCASGAKR